MKSAAKWKAIARDDVARRAHGRDRWQRVGVSCIAGRGKMTNMAWLAAELAGDPTCRQLPFLLRLDNPRDVAVLLDENSVTEPLLNLLMKEIHQKAGDIDPVRLRHHLVRLREQGRITLLIDGLAALAGLVRTAAR